MGSILLTILLSTIFILVGTLIVIKVGFIVKNATSQVLQKKVLVVSKRTSGTKLLSHYITFKFESNEQFEVYLKKEKYDIISVSDSGTLTHQGSKFIDFKSNKKDKRKK